MKFGHVFISGLVWILISACIGLCGSWLTLQSGGWPILGWPMTIIGFGFAVMSASHLWRVTNLQRQGMRMMRDDPQGFAEAKRCYEEAMRRADEAPVNGR